MTSTEALLEKVSLFHNLGMPALERLAICLKKRFFLKDSVIVSQHDPGTSLFVIEAGKVKVVLSGEGAREMILSVFRPGDFFGEMSLLDGQPRSATVVAMEDAHLLVLEREDFLAHINANPQTALNILAEMSKRLRQADEIIGNLALLDVYGRLGRLLQSLGEREGHQEPEGMVLAKRPTHQDLASMIGTSRETVSRIMADFQRQGAVVIQGRKLVLRPWFFRSVPAGR